MSDRHTCPRRVAEIGPWDHGQGLDEWRVLPNGDRTCSFCGSLHPDDFERLCEAGAKAEETAVVVSPSTKPYKVYVSQPGVRNAMHGGIKFYKQHAPPDDEWLDRVQPKFAAALEAYARRLAARNAAADGSPS